MFKHAKLAFLLLLALPIAAQSVTVANPGPKRQVRWVDFTVPISVTHSIQPQRLGGMLVLPGRQIGKECQVWHMRADLDAGQEITAANWTPSAWSDVPDAAWPALQQSTASILSLVPTLIITDPNGSRAAQCNRATIVYADRAQVVWRLELHAAGWHLECWETVWAWQAAVDVSGMAIWCDQTSPDWAKADQRVEVSWGCPAVLYGAKRQGLSQVTDGRWVLWTGQVVDGVGLPFRGVLLPKLEAMDVTLDTEDAARYSALYAAAKWPDGTWLAFGNRPDAPQVTRQSFDDFLQTSGTLADQRPGANDLAVGATGDQGCFGATKGLSAAGGNPWGLRELLWAADDWILRGGHYVSNIGVPITGADHPGWQTFGQITEHNSPNILGKSKTQPWGWDRMGPRYVGGDDQHRGTLPTEAGYALTGDWLLREDMTLRLNADEVRAKTLRGTLDEPRAGGRLWLSWANMALLMDAKEQRRLKTIALRELDMRIAAWPNTSPVRPQDITHDNRVLPGRDAWITWKESLCILGGWAEYRAWERLGDAATAAKFRDFCKELSNTVVNYGTFQDKDGGWLITAGCLWLPGGEANPPSYYVFPRAGASYGPDPGIDLLVAGGGWFDWCAASYVANGGEKAQAVIKAMRPDGSATARKVEWWALK